MTVTPSLHECFTYARERGHSIDLSNDFADYVEAFGFDGVTVQSAWNEYVDEATVEYGAKNESELDDAFTKFRTDR